MGRRAGARPTRWSLACWHRWTRSAPTWPRWWQHSTVWPSPHRLSSPRKRSPDCRSSRRRRRRRRCTPSRRRSARHRECGKHLRSWRCLEHASPSSAAPRAAPLGGRPRTAAVGATAVDRCHGVVSRAHAASHWRARPRPGQRPQRLGGDGDRAVRGEGCRRVAPPIEMCPPTHPSPHLNDRSVSSARARGGRPFAGGGERPGRAVSCRGRGDHGWSHPYEVVAS